MPVRSVDTNNRMLRRITAQLAALIPRRFRPRTELIRLIRLAHHGDISVEEFTNARVCRGRRAKLALTIADLLLDLKQQRAERAALEQEIRDRVANRTHALERKIGALQVQATRDALTGLGNRRGLDIDLPRLIQTCQAVGSDACLLMMDIDHFKPLNDTLGHAAGDQLLREIGQLIRSNLRGNDNAYRAGGDEFVILMQASSLPAGQALAGRLSSLVTALTKPLAVLHPPALSIGACTLSELKEKTPQAFLHTADERLYAVKETRATTRRRMGPRTRRSA